MAFCKVDVDGQQVVLHFHKTAHPMSLKNAWALADALCEELPELDDDPDAPEDDDDEDDDPWDDD